MQGGDNSGDKPLASHPVPGAVAAAAEVANYDDDEMNELHADDEDTFHFLSMSHNNHNKTVMMHSRTQSMKKKTTAVAAVVVVVTT